MSLDILIGEGTPNGGVTLGPAVELREISGLKEGTEDHLNLQPRGLLQTGLENERKKAVK